MGTLESFDQSARLLAVFSQTSAIELAVYDRHLRFRAVNNAAAAITGTPAEAFVGKTIRDIIGNAAPEPEARLQQVLVTAEIPAVEVTAMLPSRTALGYWVQKNFPIRDRSGRVTAIASLNVEVTAHRKLEESFHKVGNEQLWRNDAYQRLAGELHDSIDQYHVALGMNLDRLSRDTGDSGRLAELLVQSMEALDQQTRKLASVVVKCFAMGSQH
jgi:PAS domain S-box-containing protein